MQKKKQSIGLILVLSFFLGMTGWTMHRPNSDYLRLHVLANSDSAEDQSLKMAVKDGVVEYLSQQFIPVTNAVEAKAEALQHTEKIRQVAEDIVRTRGYMYPVQVRVGVYEFPEKTYDELTLPAGKYEAVRVILGEGAGQNWWCVLFPPLCIIADDQPGLELTRRENAEVKWKIKELLFPEEAEASDGVE